MTKKPQHKSKNQPYLLRKHLVVFAVIISTSLAILLIVLVGIDAHISKQIRLITIFDAPISNITLVPYPKYKQVLAATAIQPARADIHGAWPQPVFQDISAQAAIIMDDDSQTVLFSKNPTLRFSMASTTKVMTALVGLEFYSPDSELIVQSDNVPGAVAGFKRGEKFRFEDVLYAMLLPSGNDAALTIAQNYPGGVDAFVQRMNEKAAEYHLVNTHFADPAGLADEGDYTTVSELAKLASIARQNEVFAKVVATREKVITTKNGKNVYTLNNLNKLLGNYGVTGIKTGFTDEAGEVLVTSQKEDNHTLIIAVMKSQNRFLDTQKILSSINGTISYLSF